MKIELKPGLELRFPNGTVKLLSKYPGEWKCEISIKGGQTVKKTIKDRQIAEWVAASKPNVKPTGPRHPSCMEGCYTFGSGSEYRIPCEAKCRLMEPSQLDWHETRRQWNAQGLCAREACRTPMDEYRRKHPTTELQYCSECSRLLAEAQNIEMLEVV